MLDLKCKSENWRIVVPWFSVDMFFEDICTIKEIKSISQRLEVAKLLHAKKTYNEIEAETGASTATISRVNRCLMYGNGGYKTVIDRMFKEEKSE